MAVGESGGGKKSPPKNSGSEKFRGRNPKAKTQAVGESGGGASEKPSYCTHNGCQVSLAVVRSLQYLKAQVARSLVDVGLLKAVRQKTQAVGESGGQSIEQL